MKNNKNDIFEGIKHIPSEEINNNFFLTENILSLNKQPKTDSSKRLNDYDYNLLKEDAYKEVNDDLFRLEYRISKIEKYIKNNNIQLESAKEIGDYKLIEELSTKRKFLEDDYKRLLALYNDKSFSAKISDKILNLFGIKIKNNIKNIKISLTNYSDKIISKMSRQFSTFLKLRKTLNKLENLNQSVSDLITLNIPYGEHYNKYDQLSKYIIKANSIHANISQQINKK